MHVKLGVKSALGSYVSDEHLLMYYMAVPISHKSTGSRYYWGRSWNLYLAAALT